MNAAFVQEKGKTQHSKNKNSAFFCTLTSVRVVHGYISIYQIQLTNFTQTANGGEAHLRGDPQHKLENPQMPSSSAYAPNRGQIIPTEHQRQGMPSASPTWTGKLAKSGSLVCSIHCLEGPRQEVGGANGMVFFTWRSFMPQFALIGPI